MYLTARHRRIGRWSALLAVYAFVLNALLAEFPELMLGSYPKINELNYRVLLTLESRDKDYLDRAADRLARNLPADAIHLIE